MALLLRKYSNNAAEVGYVYLSIIEPTQVVQLCSTLFNSGTLFALLYFTLKDVKIQTMCGGGVVGLVVDFLIIKSFQFVKLYQM